MKKLTKEEIKHELDLAYKRAGSNAYFRNGFEAGVKFALEKLNGDTEKRVANCGAPLKVLPCSHYDFGRCYNQSHCNYKQFT